MTESFSQSQQTGTRNETYDVIAILYHALQGAENCQTYLQNSCQELGNRILRRA